jgi:sec-independent protein translocase protein TatB
MASPVGALALVVPVLAAVRLDFRDGTPREPLALALIIAFATQAGAHLCPGGRFRRLAAVLGILNSLGGGEVIVILVLALIVLGPEKLPDAIRKVGNIYGELRRMSEGFQSEFRDAFDEPIRELRGTAQVMQDAVQQPLQTDLASGPVEEVQAPVEEAPAPVADAVDELPVEASPDEAAPASAEEPAPSEGDGGTAG